MSISLRFMKPGALCMILGVLIGCGSGGGGRAAVKPIVVPPTASSGGLVILTAPQTVGQADGTWTVVIAAIDSNGSPLANANVALSSTSGQLGIAAGQTNAAGTLATTITPPSGGPTPRIAAVKATSGVHTAVTNVVFQNATVQPPHTSSTSRAQRRLHPKAAASSLSQFQYGTSQPNWDGGIFYSSPNPCHVAYDTTPSVSCAKYYAQNNLSIAPGVLGDAACQTIDVTNVAIGVLKCAGYTLAVTGSCVAGAVTTGPGDVVICAGAIEFTSATLGVECFQFLASEIVQHAFKNNALIALVDEIGLATDPTGLGIASLICDVANLSDPVNASVSILNFTQLGTANAQQFSVSQAHFTGTFKLSGTDPTIATAKVSGNTVTITPIAPGVTNITVTGGGFKSVSIQIVIAVSFSPVTTSVSSLTFTQVGAANAQHFTVSQTNFTGAFTLTPGINTAIATAQISGNTVTVTPIAAGSTSVTVVGGGGQSVTVPIAVSSPVIAEFAISNPNSGPSGITAGPDGAIWFTEQNAGKIGRITTAGVITAEYPIVTANSNAFPVGITTGPDGALWFTNTNKIGRLSTSGAFSEFPIPVALNDGTSIGAGMGITTGSDGALWFPAASNNFTYIIRMTTAGAVTHYPIPSGPIRYGAYDIVGGPDGALWFTLKNNVGSGSKIGRMTTSGAYGDYIVPSGYNVASGIAAGPDGALWFTEYISGGGTGKIGRVSTSGAFNEYPVPTGDSAAVGIAVGVDGALWFTEGDAWKIGRITTAGAIAEFTVPTFQAEVYRITAGPDGALWFTEFGGAGNPKIGKIAP